MSTISDALISAAIASLTAAGAYHAPISRPGTPAPIVERAPIVEPVELEPPVEAAPATEVWSVGWIPAQDGSDRLVCVTGAPCEHDPQYRGAIDSSFNWITGEQQ